MMCCSLIPRPLRHCAGRNSKTEVSLWNYIKRIHLMFFVHTTQEEFKNTTITAHFGPEFEKNFSKEITLPRRHPFRRAPFWKCFSFTIKRKSSVFKFLRFDERFRNAPFSCRISADGRPNRRNKATFSNISGVVW